MFHYLAGMIAVDSDKNISCGSSSNGLRFKIPGRVGSSAIVGAGAYCQNGVGAAAATGNGDTLMRYLVSLQAVQVCANIYTSYIVPSINIVVSYLWS